MFKLATALILITLLSDLSTQNPVDDIYIGIEKPQEYYDLPKLPYSYDSMLPWIDAETMKVHHSGHHRAYTAKMNAALQEWRASGEENELAKSSILHILKNINKVPEKWRTAIRNNGGGYVNHIMYFATMSPNPHGIDQTISPHLISQFQHSFHNVSYFKKWINDEALKLFGSGYVWLCRVPSHNFLTIYPTGDQISPISYSMQPILVIDVWEHAYYLKNQNKRKDYIQSWWNLVDWAKVERLHNWWKSLEPSHHEL